MVKLGWSPRPRYVFSGPLGLESPPVLTVGGDRLQPVSPCHRLQSVDGNRLLSLLAGAGFSRLGGCRVWWPDLRAFGKQPGTAAFGADGGAILWAGWQEPQIVAAVRAAEVLEHRGRNLGET